MRSTPLVAFCWVLSACGGSPSQTSWLPEPETKPDAQGQIAAEGLLGAIDEEEVQRVFDKRQQQLLHCYSAALEDIEELSGDLEISVRVAESGKVSTVFLTRSSLGSSVVEDCVVRRVSSFSFPRPKGGPAELTYPLELFSGMQEPPEISSDAFEAIREQYQQDIDRCQGAHSKVTLTFYIDAGGKVISAGGGAPSREGYEAAQCIARAAAMWIFPEPGTSIAKGTAHF